MFMNIAAVFLWYIEQNVRGNEPSIPHIGLKIFRSMKSVRRLDACRTWKSSVKSAQMTLVGTLISLTNCQLY